MSVSWPANTPLSAFPLQTPVMQDLQNAWQSAAKGADADNSGGLDITEFGHLLASQQGGDGQSINMQASASLTCSLVEVGTGRVVASNTITDTFSQTVGYGAGAAAYGQAPASLLDLFKSLDSNGDGSVSGAELAAGAKATTQGTQTMVSWALPEAESQA